MSKQFISSLYAFPHTLRAALDRLPDNDTKHIQEIRVRVGKPLIFTTDEGARFLHISGEISITRPSSPYIPTKTEVSELYKNLCGGSVYAHTDELKKGYIAMRYGHRAGVCGTLNDNMSLKNITSINDLVSGISNDTRYEITTTISMDSVESTKLQEIANTLFGNDGRISFKGLNNGPNNQINIVRATSTEISQVGPILGNFNGITNEINIRIYNCSDNDINTIKNNYDVVNIQKF